MKNILIFLLILLSAGTAYAADGITITEGVGTTLAADEVAGVKIQRMKIVKGIDGVNGGDVSDTNRWPIGTNRTDGFSATSPADITDTTTTEVQAAGGSGVRYYIESFTVSNSAATVGTVVELLDGNTVKWQCPAGADFGGCVQSFGTPLRFNANSPINCRNQTTGAQVRCSVSGFQMSE